MRDGRGTAAGGQVVARRFVGCRRDLGQRSVSGLLAGLALTALVSGVVREPLRALAGIDLFWDREFTALRCGY